MFSLEKISSAMLAAVVTWTLSGCGGPEDASKSRVAETPDEQPLGTNEAASAKLEVCEDDSPVGVKLKELTLTDFVIVARQEGAGVCPAYTPCWSGVFAEEVPAQTAIRFRATDKTLPCDQEIRIDIVLSLAISHRLRAGLCRDAAA
jgi:hypothetical protein